MPEINLLQPEKKTRVYSLPHGFSAQKAVWVMVGLLILELAGYGLFLFLTQRLISENQSRLPEIAELDNKIQHPEKELTTAVKAQAALQTVEEMLGSHIHWTAVWSELSKTTLKTVQYISITAAADNNGLVVEGRTSNYQELGKVMLGLQTSDNFNEIQLVSSTQAKEGAGVDFAIAVIFKPSLLQNVAGTTE